MTVVKRRTVCSAMQLFVDCVQCNNTELCYVVEVVAFVAACIVSNRLPCICQHKMPEDNMEANTENTEPLRYFVVGIRYFRNCKY